ncbi:hypothetical protein ACHAXS_002833 [Conticribra weissflogii]
MEIRKDMYGLKQADILPNADIEKSHLHKKGLPQDSQDPDWTKKHGKASQYPILEDNDPSTRKKQVQQVVQSVLYYAQAVDITLLMELSN